MRWREVRGALAGGAGAILLVFGAGCASPGPALPPSLNLPAVVTDLAATRVGDEVRLRWTTPERTTDKLAVKGPIEAEICREVSGTAARVAGGGAKACSPVVVRFAVVAGASEASDPLPAALTAGAPGLLAYRVQLRNAVGRTAGPSAAVFAASGAAPQAVEGLCATAVKGGAMLEWRRSAAGDVVELDRSLVAAPVVADAAAVPGTERKGAKEAAEVRLRVAGDPGGAVDRTTVTGWSYRYTAQRVRMVVVGGRSLEVRSVASASVPVAMLDVFPPEAPVGLVASPGFVGDGQRPTIDLSWEPGMEAGIAGYRVYRRNGNGNGNGEGDGAWQRLNSAVVAVPAYRDMTVEAGRRYGYRVTAVDGVGNESGPSGEVVETAPGQ